MAEPNRFVFSGMEKLPCYKLKELGSIMLHLMVEESNSMYQTGMKLWTYS